MKNTLTEEEVKEVKRLESEVFGGVRKLAVAAVLHSVGYVQKFAGKLPNGLDKGQIGRLSAQVTRSEKKAKNKV